MKIKRYRIASWKDGELPQPGMYLRTKKGVTYKVLVVHPNTRPDPKSLCSVSVFRLTLDDLNDLKDDVVFYPVEWV